MKARPRSSQTTWNLEVKLVIFFHLGMKYTAEPLTQVIVISVFFLTVLLLY